MSNLQHTHDASLPWQLPLSLLSVSGVEYEYDLAVIGGGSGGMAVAKKAAGYGAKVREKKYGANAWKMNCIYPTVQTISQFKHILMAVI